MDVRFCNEMLELCGEQETALDNWEASIKDGDLYTVEQHRQINKERQALAEIQDAIMKYFRVRDGFNQEFEVAYKVPERKGLFGHSKPEMVIRKRQK